MHVNAVIAKIELIIIKNSLEEVLLSFKFEILEIL
jgi:hypothetical protein